MYIVIYLLSLVENGKRFINMKFKLPAALLLTGMLSGLLIGCTSGSQNDAEKNNDGTNTAVAKTEIYWVAPERVPCQGIVPMQCLVVNKVVDGKTSEWQYFYNDIAGFEYKPGSFYKLSVETSEVANPAADASSLAYKLIAEIDKKQNHYAENTMLTENRQWNLKQLTGLGNVNPMMLKQPAYISIAGDRLSGFSGCNNIFGQVQHLFEAEEVQNSLLKLGPLGSTLMACADPNGNAVEQKLQQVLGDVNAIKVQWPFLNMYQNDELMIQFVAEDWD
ncbi:MAG: heat shock protein HslJ [Moritella dasanensis]